MPVLSSDEEGSTDLVIDQNQIGAPARIAYPVGVASSCFLIYVLLAGSESPTLLRLAIPPALALLAWTFFFRIRILINTAERLYAWRIDLFGKTVWLSDRMPISDAATVVYKSYTYGNYADGSGGSCRFNDVLLADQDEELLIARKRKYNNQRPPELEQLARRLSEELKCPVSFESE